MSMQELKKDIPIRYLIPKNFSKDLKDYIKDVRHRSNEYDKHSTSKTLKKEHSIQNMTDKLSEFYNYC